jgi:hypothetical protein
LPTVDMTNGFLIAASAFITIAGIILAFNSQSARIGWKSMASLCVSMAIGTALIVTMLNWFNDPPQAATWGWLLLAGQLATFYLPLWILAVSFGNKRKM